MALLSLLSGVTSPELEPIKQQAFAIAEQAIVIANEEIAKIQVEVPVAPQKENKIKHVVETTAEQTNMVQNNLKFKIISKFRKNYESYDWDYLDKTSTVISDSERSDNFELPDEKNSVDVLFVIKNNREYRKDLVVDVECTDKDQNKKINGTGAVRKMHDESKSKKIIPYYGFNYKFKTSGNHTLTFTVDGHTESVNFNVSEPKK